MKLIGRSSKTAAEMCFAVWLHKKMRRRLMNTRSLSIVSGIPESTLGYVLAGKRVVDIQVFNRLTRVFMSNRGHKRRAS